MKAGNIAQSGIITALTLAILYSASLLPISTFSILTIASCLIPVSIIRTSIKSTILVYLSCSILSFFFVPINIALLYTSFFGIYGIIKYFIEKLDNIIFEIIIKLTVFNVLLFVIYYFFSALIGFNAKIALWLLFIMAQAAFLIYDYAMTIIISFFINRINKHL